MEIIKTFSVNDFADFFKSKITRLPGYPSANLSDPAVTPFRQHPLDSEDDFGFTSADH